MTQHLEGFYEAPLAAWLAAHGIALDAAWRDRLAGHGADLRPWKRARILPRIRVVLSQLKSFSPRSVLDIGSGRGAFLWPAHEELESTHFVAVDLPGSTADRLAAVQSGGLPRFTAVAASADHLPFEDASFEWATALEVLEHLHDPTAAAGELARVTTTGVIITVPRLPDQNPEHLRCYDEASLHGLLAGAGFAKVRIQPVDDCWFATARHLDRFRLS